MYIKQVQIDNFGKFHQKNITFTPEFNVIYGENESGKSTLMGFLRGMLFGLEKKRGRSSADGSYEKYEPWNVVSYYTGSMDFDVSGKRFTIERNFYHKEKTARLYNQQDGEELSVDHGDLEVLLAGITGEFYENTFCIPQASVITQSSFADKLQQEMANVLGGGELGIDIAGAEKILTSQRKQQEQLLKKCQQQKQEQLDRLEWEQNLLQGDIREIEQKILMLPIGRNTIETEEKKIFKIPVIGWILRFFRWIWRKIRRQNSKEESQNVSSLDILKEQLEEKQMRLLNVEEEMEEGRMLTPQEKEVQKEIESLRLAMEVLEHAKKEGYQDGKDEILATVSSIFSQITEGKYDRVEMDENGKMFLYIGEKKIEPWQMSRGTLEQLYLALRLGVGRCILKEETMPILLDETFCAYDEKRLKQTLLWLSKQDNQIILFTCQKRELVLLEELSVKYNQILL